MWQAKLYGAGDLRFEQAPLDTTNLAPGELFVETDVSALSTGTDLGNFQGGSTYVPGAPDYPRWVGYSNAGIVRAVGSGVKSVAAGDRVFTTRPHLSAFRAPESAVWAKIPAEVPSDQASLAYIANLGLQALHKASFRPGEDVAVVGLGVIGLCTVAIARALGAANVYAIVNAPQRVEAALKAGATEARNSDHVWMADHRDQLADVVVLTANTWAAYLDALNLVRTCGRVAILGFPGRGEPAPDFNPLAPEWIYRKQLALFGDGLAPTSPAPAHEVRFNLNRSIGLLFDLLRQKRLDFGPIISHRFPAHKMIDAYRLAAERDKRLNAAVFDWSPYHGQH